MQNRIILAPEAHVYLPNATELLDKEIRIDNHLVMNNALYETDELPNGSSNFEVLIANLHGNGHEDTKPDMGNNIVLAGSGKFPIQQCKHDEE